MIERETSTANLYYYPEDNLLYVVCKKDFKMSIEEAKEHEAAVLSLLKRPCIFIIDCTYTDGIFTSEAQSYFSKSEKLNKFRSHYIFIIKNLAQRIIANYYGSLIKRQASFKVVKSKESAFNLAKKVQ